MGHKIVCLECRKSFSQGTDFNNRKDSNCPDCGKLMTQLPHRYRPPKKTDDKKWNTVRFLVENGFPFQHIYENVERNKDGIVKLSNLVKYPETLNEAKEFVEKYKSQALIFKK